MLDAGTTHFNAPTLARFGSSISQQLDPSVVRYTALDIIRIKQNMTPIMRPLWVGLPSMWYCSCLLGAGTTGYPPTKFLPESYQG